MQRKGPWKRPSGGPIENSIFRSYRKFSIPFIEIVQAMVMIGAHGEYKLMVVFLHAISHIPATGPLKKTPHTVLPFSSE